MAFRAQFAHGTPSSGDMSSAKSPISGPSPARSARPIPTGAGGHHRRLALKRKRLRSWSSSRCCVAALAVSGGSTQARAASGCRRAFSDLPGWQNADLKPALGRLSPRLRRDRRQTAGEPMQRLCRHGGGLADGLRAAHPAMRAASLKRISRPIGWAAQRPVHRLLRAGNPRQPAPA